MWTRLDEDKRLCNEWLKEPLLNPKTGLPIDRNGPTFMYWKEKCKQLGLKKNEQCLELTWRKCQEWRKNPLVNPDSGRDIKRNGPTYKWLEKECKCIEKKVTLLGEYYLPDNKGMVPCIINNNTVYVIRNYNERKIWGPLNKPAKRIILCYYADSWDFRNNHYKPIFLDGPKPKKPQINIIKINKISQKNSILYESKNKKDDPKKVIDKIVDFFIK